MSKSEAIIDVSNVPVVIAGIDTLGLFGAIDDMLSDKSDETVRKYHQRLKHFVKWLIARDAQTIDKRTVAAYKKHLAHAGKSASTVNGHLVAVRRLVAELADLELIDDKQADRALKVKSVKQQGRVIGNWLSREDAQRVLDAPDVATLKGKRDRAILAVLLFGWLRRSEVISITVSQLRQIEGHHVIADIIGKHGRVRTVKTPVSVKRAIDAWLVASGRVLADDSPVFVSMRKGGHIVERQMSSQQLYRLVAHYGGAIGHPELRPHDLRRTGAKLADRAGSPLLQTQIQLGHASLDTTRLYIKPEIDLDAAGSDFVRLVLKVTTDD